MARDTQQILARINAILTLTDKFPMGILSSIRWKTYTSALDYVIDVLIALGCNPRDILQELIKELFGMTTDPTKTDDDSESVAEKEYNDDVSNFLRNLEDSTKVILMNILTGLFSCSAIPEIPNWDMDNQYDKLSGRGISIPISMLDYSDMLSIYPLSTYGNNFYDAKNEMVLGANTLYRTYDMNAFIWYCVNRASTSNWAETNKLVWDSRRTAKEYGVTMSSDDMTKWVNSRQSWDDYLQCDVAPYSKYSSYFPILQFFPDEGNTRERRIVVTFPSQRYHKKAYPDEEKKTPLFNKSLYKFNEDYLNSIRIYNPKVILSYMLEALYGFRINSLFTVNLEKRIIEEKLTKVINNAIEADDMEINDCYYTFSNDDYNRMLNETLMQKYQSKAYGDEAIKSTDVDIEDLQNQLKEINSASTSVEKTTKITKLVNDLTATPRVEGNTSYGVDVSVNNGWLKELINAIVTPLAKSMLTPQVMLLFLINFHELGLINLKNIIGNNDEIMSFFLNKMLAAIISIVKYVKDKIIELLLKLLEEKLIPLIEKYFVMVFKERYEYWIKLLQEAITSCALIRFKRNKTQSQIDEVDYADIIPNQTVPVSGSAC